jgi:hypothetical protein
MQRASSYATKFWGEAFTHSTVKCHSNMWNWLFGLHSLRCQNYEHALDFAFRVSHLFQSRWVWILRVWLTLSSPNACLTITRVITLFFGDLHKIRCCSFVGSITKLHSWRVWTFHVWLALSSPNARLIIARMYITLLLRFAQNLMLFLCWIHCKTASGQI